MRKAESAERVLDYLEFLEWGFWSLECLLNHKADAENIRPYAIDQDRIQIRAPGEPMIIVTHVAVAVKAALLTSLNGSGILLGEDLRVRILWSMRHARRGCWGHTVTWGHIGAIAPMSHWAMRTSSGFPIVYHNLVCPPLGFKRHVWCLSCTSGKAD